LSKKAPGRLASDDNELYAIETAVDEAFSNIIDHAYLEEGVGDIECTCLSDAENLTIILRDHGLPFNPDEIPQPVIDCCLEDRTERGLGLFVMRRYMDDINFEFFTGKWQHSHHDQAPRDVVVIPELQNIGLFDWKRLPQTSRRSG